MQRRFSKLNSAKRPVFFLIQRKIRNSDFKNYGFNVNFESLSICHNITPAV